MVELDNYFLFRLVPTMRCNFRCSYCFEDNSLKGKNAPTMFDIHPVEEWIEAMKLYSDKKIEFYMWGGEPFVLDDTYTLVREWAKMDHVIPNCRIDTNISFADRIARECPTDKVKLNCSYHMQYHTLEEELRKVKLLKSLDMVGMVNFVASEYNLKKLKEDYNLTVFDLIKKFEEIDVFLNIAGDFAITSNPNDPRYTEYKEFILQFITDDDWAFLRDERKETRLCSAGMKMFTLRHSGKIASCISDKVYGNFFEGKINPDNACTECSTSCPSIIQYPFREDNNFKPQNNLMEYVWRNDVHRKTMSNFNNFIF